jgi:hypothetical protein
MAAKTGEFLSSSSTRLVIRIVVYYAALIALGSLVWNALPHSGIPGKATLESLFGVTAPTAPVGKKDIGSQLDQLTLGITVVVAMVSSVLLSLPVAWMYQLTRAKRGYQQSVVQLLLILPIVVSGIVVLVKYSLALAFSLAGIVAAVRFRNTLDDSKDAVYVFLATGVGLAAAVDVPVATAISIVFNITVFIIWYTDFGHSPLELEGRIAQQRLRRARQLARTGTFVAQIDAEVLRNMNKEQLEGVAQRAWKRAHTEGGTDTADKDRELRLRLRSNDISATRTSVEPQLEQFVKSWRFVTIKYGDGTAGVVDYLVQLKKSSQPEDLLSIVRGAAGTDLIEADLT